MRPVLCNGKLLQPKGIESETEIHPRAKGTRQGRYHRPKDREALPVSKLEIERGKVPLHEVRRLSEQKSEDITLLEYTEIDAELSLGCHRGVELTHRRAQNTGVQIKRALHVRGELS